MDDQQTQPAYGAWVPEQTEEQLQAEVLAKQRLEASLPVIEDVLTWFDDRIATYSNPTCITGVNPSSDPEVVKQAVLFAQTLITEYTQQCELFKSQFSAYIKHKDSA